MMNVVPPETMLEALVVYEQGMEVIERDCVEGTPVEDKLPSAEHVFVFVLLRVPHVSCRAGGVCT